MSDEAVDRVQTMARVMDALPEDKQRILLAYGEGMAAVVSMQSELQGEAGEAQEDSA